MRTFSAVDSAAYGFKVVKERPVSVTVWALVWLVAGYGPLALLLMHQFPDMLNLFRDLKTASTAVGPANSQAVFAKMMAFEMGLWGVIWPWMLWCVVLTSVLAAATYRAILNPGERAFAYLRLGGDELRLFLLHFIMTLLWIVFGIVLGATGVALSFAVKAVPQPWTGWVGFLCVLVLLAVAIYVPVRLSFAPVLTFADKKIRVFESWAVTRGRFRRTLGMILLMFLFVVAVMLAAALVRQAIVFGVGMGSGGFAKLAEAAQAQTQDPGQLIQAMLVALGPAIAAAAVVQVIVESIVRVLAIAPWAAAYKALHADDAD
jgi:hypothetical protein